MNQHYDLIAIGGGSGGLAAAETAAKFGKKAAVVDPGLLGGTCVNNGCVPKKVMWHAASLAHDIGHASDFGIAVSQADINWKKLVEGRNNYISNINKYWGNYVVESGIDHIKGTARFINNHTLEVNGQQLTADHIVLSTGSQPIVPRLPGAELGITSDDFFELNQRPEKVAVIGGGYIGVELSGVLNALGSEVARTV